jgi:hypothetical protein
MQQLNFYAFRKIKYADTIRIDPKLEAETANYWRFRHDKFRRGHSEWLSEIKRMNGAKTVGTSSGNGNGNTSKTTTTTSTNNNNNTTNSNVDKEHALKTEVYTLKQRIEDMTKNIDHLSNMVQQVSLQSKQQHRQEVVPNMVPSSTSPQQQQVQVLLSDVLGSKRKKMDLEDPAMPPMPDRAVSLNNINMILSSDSSNDTANFMMDIMDTNDNNVINDDDDTMDLLLAPPSIPSPMRIGSSGVGVGLGHTHTSTTTTTTTTNQRETSACSELSDQGFVDQLFTAFKTEDFEFDEMEQNVDAVPPSSSTCSNPTKDNNNNVNVNVNRPDPALMERLSEALAMLPRDIQELIVDRLIQAITSPKQIQDYIQAAQLVKQAVSAVANAGGGSVGVIKPTVSPLIESSCTTTTTTLAIPLVPTTATTRAAAAAIATAAAEPQMSMPLAAATLAALLSQYGVQQQQQKNNVPSGKTNNAANKSLPVIPVHA